jgi:hypothetical protein
MDTSNYKPDHLGRLVPIQSIRPIDLLRDDLVNRIAIKTRALNDAMSHFKKITMGEILSFCSESADQYGVKFGGDKGNIQLQSFDGKYRVTVSVAEYIVFDERLSIAKQLIDECITDWTQGSNSNIIALINNAFSVNKQGKINTDRILSLRRLDIKDEKWKRAMEAISDSVNVTSSKNYIRIYEQKDGEYVQIPLDLASI